MSALKGVAMTIQQIYKEWLEKSHGRCILCSKGRLAMSIWITEIGRDGEKKLKTGVQEGGGPPPGYRWSVLILDMAFSESKFLS